MGDPAAGCHALGHQVPSMREVTSETSHLSSPRSPHHPPTCPRLPRPLCAPRAAGLGAAPSASARAAGEAGPTPTTAVAVPPPPARLEDIISSCLLDIQKSTAETAELLRSLDQSMRVIQSAITSKGIAVRSSGGFASQALLMLALTSGAAAAGFYIAQRRQRMLSS